MDPLIEDLDFVAGAMTGQAMVVMERFTGVRVTPEMGAGLDRWYCHRSRIGGLVVHFRVVPGVGWRTSGRAIATHFTNAAAGTEPPGCADRVDRVSLSSTSCLFRTYRESEVRRRAGGQR
jgi:hypothetical protein